MGSSAPKRHQNMWIPSIRRFHPGVCFTCFVHPPAHLHRCAQCQLVCYCSRVCQRKDWLNHRPFCIENKNMHGKNHFHLSKEKVKHGEDWFEIRSSLLRIFSSKIIRSLSLAEIDIFYFPRVCEICKESTHTKLKHCLGCYSVFYCSEEHLKENSVLHSTWCSNYLLNMECDSVETKLGILDLPFPTDIEDVEYKKLPKDLMTLLHPQLQVEEGDLDPRKVTMITERLSYPLTLLYALEKLGVGSPFQRLEVDSMVEMTVHVIGAKSSVELLGIVRWEYFLHRLPKLRKIKFVFVGPEIFSIPGYENDEVPDQYCVDDSGITRCPECEKAGRLVVYEMVALKYDQFINSSHYSEPECVVCFNCDFHKSGDDWLKSLELIVNNVETPLIFTSFSREEVEKDLDVIRKCGLVKVEFSNENAFRSLRPIRDPLREGNCPLFFSNHYVTAVRAAKYNSLSFH